MEPCRQVVKKKKKKRQVLQQLFKEGPKQAFEAFEMKLGVLEGLSHVFFLSLRTLKEQCVPKLWLRGLGGTLSLPAKTPLGVPSCYRRSSCAIYKFTKTSAILGTCFPGNMLYLFYAIEITCILYSAAALPAFPRDDAMQRLHACVIKICALVLKSSSAQSKVSIGSTDAFQVLAPFSVHAMKCHVTLHIDTTWKCRELLNRALRLLQNSEEGKVLQRGHCGANAFFFSILEPARQLFCKCCQFSCLSCGGQRNYLL